MTAVANVHRIPDRKLRTLPNGRVVAVLAAQVAEPARAWMDPLLMTIEELEAEGVAVTPTALALRLDWTYSTAYRRLRYVRDLGQLR